jgi:hypothetical protein
MHSFNVFAHPEHKQPGDAPRRRSSAEFEKFAPHKRDMAPTESAVWAHVTKLENDKRGNQKACCKGCGSTHTQAPALWWKHLLDCEGQKDEEQAAFARSEAVKHKREKEEKEARSRARPAARFAQASVIKLNQKQLNEAADKAIATWAFATGQPLRAVDDYYFRDAIEKVVAAGPQRSHVGRKRLKEQLLPEIKKRVARDQQALLDLRKALWGLTLVSDGWTDANKRPLLNVLLVCPEGEIFIEAIDTSGDTKSMEYVADKLGKHITSDVDMVVMDGACKGALNILIERFPWLSGVVCTTHSLDLLMEDLGKMAFAAEPLASARQLVKFINNHHKTRAMFIKLSDVVLLSPAPTRFGFNLMMVERLLRCKDAVRKLVASAEYDEWRRAQSAELRREAK